MRRQTAKRTISHQLMEPFVCGSVPLSGDGGQPLALHIAKSVAGLPPLSGSGRARIVVKVAALLFGGEIEEMTLQQAIKLVQMARIENRRREQQRHRGAKRVEAFVQDMNGDAPRYFRIVAKKPLYEGTGFARRLLRSTQPRRAFRSPSTKRFAGPSQL